jgi:hypothetical protein
MALWKLDRVDSTRKRRRRTAPKTGGGTEQEQAHLLSAEDEARSMGGLQELFEGEYGFEEVSARLLIRLFQRCPEDSGQGLMLKVSRDTMIR